MIYKGVDVNFRLNQRYNMLLRLTLLCVAVASIHALCDKEPRVYTPPVGKTIGFYNMFDGDHRVFADVVKEQVAFIATFINRIDKIHTVYFGDHHATFSVPGPKYVRSPASAQTGSEIVTQTLLHSHCVAHPQDQVIYIHTKGSFHSHTTNDALRRNLMHGVRGCVETNALAVGDVCGLRTSPIPHPHYSGNMWTARCDYVAMLPNPVAFQQLMGTIAKQGCIDWSVGKDRFSVEHWILSHPSVVPMDVLPSLTTFVWGYEGLQEHPTWRAELEHFPRKGMDAAMFFTPLPDMAQQFITCSASEYRLSEYRSLFGDTVLANGLANNTLYCQWYESLAKTLY